MGGDAVGEGGCWGGEGGDGNGEIQGGGSEGTGRCGDVEGGGGDRRFGVGGGDVGDDARHVGGCGDGGCQGGSRPCTPFRCHKNPSLICSGGSRILWPGAARAVKQHKNGGGTQKNYKSVS